MSEPAAAHQAEDMAAQFAVLPLPVQAELIGLCRTASLMNELERHTAQRLLQMCLASVAEEGHEVMLAYGWLQAGCLQLVRITDFLAAAVDASEHHGASHPTQRGEG